MAVAVCTAALLAGPALAGDAVSILGMAWTQQPAPALVVSASGGLTYSETQPAPGVLVILFPEAVPAAPIAAVTEPAVGLKAATLAASTDPGRVGSELRIELEPGVNAVVTALPSGLEVRFQAAGATLAAGTPRNLTDVLPVADEAGVTIHLASNAQLTGKTFTLANPPRLVVDLPGVVNRVQRRVHPVAASGVQRVRVSQFAMSPEPVVRVVVDLDSSLPFVLEPRPEGAVLRLGAAPAPVAVAEAQPAEVVPASPPTQVAEVASVTPAVTEPAPAASQPEPAPVAEQPATPEVTAEAAPQPQRTIVNEPVPEPVAPVEAATQPPAETPAAFAEAQPALTEPPVKAARTEQATPPAESPWTTTPAAMAEQAAPPSPASPGTQEVESQEKHFTGEPISLELKDADVKDVLRTFAKITGLNVVVDPEVTGAVTVQLENVPWDQALDIILRINGLTYQVENNVLRVTKLEKLKAEKETLAKYLEEAEKSKPMRTVRKVLSYMSVQEATSVLVTGSFLLSKYGTLIQDPRNNAITIRDTADRVPGILALIDEMDVPVQQVIIEARIVEATRNFARKIGVSWGFNANNDAQHGTTTGWRFPYTAITTGAVEMGAAPVGTGGYGTIGFAFADILNAFNLDFVLSAAENNGYARIVSSPKVMAQNNKQAHIQSGLQIPIQTVANNTVTVQYVDATLALDVTPQITAEGTVILDIDIKKREPATGISIVGATNTPITTRDAKTKLMVKDGGTTIIGGIYSYSENKSQTSVPGLSKIPILGYLFRDNNKETRHDELLLFITPRIVKY